MVKLSCKNSKPMWSRRHGRTDGRQTTDNFAIAIPRRAASRGKNVVRQPSDGVMTHRKQQKNGGNTFAAYRRNVDYCETIITNSRWRIITICFIFAVFDITMSKFQCTCSLLFRELITYVWERSCHLASCDVIRHVTIRFAIGHFLLVVLWNRVSICIV